MKPRRAAREAVLAVALSLLLCPSSGRRTQAWTHAPPDSSTRLLSDGDSPGAVMAQTREDVGAKRRVTLRDGGAKPGAEVGPNAAAQESNSYGGLTFRTA
jgi:hypothetical protein